jgi:hypothetical protein
MGEEIIGANQLKDIDILEYIDSLAGGRKSQSRAKISKLPHKI